jgi:hypothetical protein
MEEVAILIQDVVRQLNLSKYIVLAVLFIPVLVFGNTDSTSFIKHKSKMEFKPYFVVQKLSLKLEGNNSLASYEPGLTGSVGLSASYKFFGLSFGRSIFSEKMGDLQNESEYFDLRLNYSGRRAALDINFQWFIGFSLADFPPNLPDSLKETIQPNLDLVNYGVNFYYALNKKMSLQSIYKYNERQLKSAGSIIVGLRQNFIQLSYSSTIFPEELLIGNGASSGNEGEFLTIIPVIGYQYNFIKEKIHFSPYASVGYGAQYQRYFSESKGDFKGFRKATAISFNLPLGYNGDRIYYGAIGKYNQTVSDIQTRGSMNYSLFSLKFFLGFRFK